MHVWWLTEADTHAAGALLARAFADEPVFVAAAPDPELRARRMPAHFAAAARFARRNGEAWAAGPELGTMAGIALTVDAPYDWPDDEALAALGEPMDDPAWKAVRAYVAAYIARGMEHVGPMPPRWSELDTIAVDPARQGRGVGSALLRHVVASARAAGLPVTLVTGRPENLPFYARAGFAAVWAGTSEDERVPLWTLRTP